MKTIRRHWRRWVVALAAVAIVIAMPDRMSAEAAPTADQICDASKVGAEEHGTISSLSAAESADLDAIATWQEARLAALEWRSPLRDLDPSRRWTVCLYRGEFVTPTGVTEDGKAMPPHNMLRVLIAEDGTVILESAGYEGHMGPTTPRDLVP